MVQKREEGNIERLSSYSTPARRSGKVQTVPCSAASYRAAHS